LQVDDHQPLPASIIDGRHQILQASLDLETPDSPRYVRIRHAFELEPRLAASPRDPFPDSDAIQVDFQQEPVAAGTDDGGRHQHRQQQSQ